MSFRSDRGNTFALKEAHLKRLVREWDGGDFDISGKDEGLFGNDEEENGGVSMDEDKPPSPPPRPHRHKPKEPPPQEQPPPPPQPPTPPQEQLPQPPAPQAPLPPLSQAPQPPPQPPQAQPQPLQIEDTLAQERQRLSNREAQLAHEYANLRQLYEAERSQLALHHGKQQRFTEEAVIQAREDTVKAREEAERLRVDNLALQAALEQQRREADALRAPLLHLMDVDVPAPAPPPAPTTQDLREQQRAAVEAVQRSGNIGGGQMQVDPPEAPLPPQAPPQPPQVKPQARKRAHVSETFQTPDGTPPPSQALALIPKPDDKPKAPTGFVGAKKPRLVIDNFTDPHFKQAEQSDKDVKELITNATPEEKAAFQSSKKLKKLLDKNLDARHRGNAIYRAMKSILASLKKKENPVAGRNPRTKGYKKGGIVKATGKALVHKGEVVLPAHLAKPLVSKFHQWFKEY